MKTKSPCGAADLLAAILGTEANVIRHKYNLPLKEGRPRYVPLACDSCGKIFQRSEKYVIWHASHAAKLKPYGQQHYFCNQVCFGRWSGKRNRKYDYDMIWQKHLETGFGSPRLSKLLHMQVTTVTRILAKKRLMTEEDNQDVQHG